ncbi:MAG: regulatory protein GemA [Reyranella sp.]|nr:regulatory protein GemA [Reyranella sp.]
MIDRATLAAIHVAKKDRGLDDDSYRDLLERVAGVRSARDLDGAGADRVMAEMRRLGFAPAPRKPRAPHDRRPIAGKARALWISLHHLDELQHGTDKALNGFVRRITGKGTLAWCTNGEANKVVESLKAWLGRVGVDAETAHGLLGPQQSLVRELWRRLDAAMREGRAGDERSIAAIRDAGRRVAFVRDLDGPRLNVLAGQLGFHVRRLKLGHRHRNPSRSEGA